LNMGRAAFGMGGGANKASGFGSNDHSKVKIGLIER